MLKNLGYFLLSSGIVGSGTLGFFGLKCYQNRRRLEKETIDEEVRDTTRPQYDFFGINWGAKADMMVGLLSTRFKTSSALGTSYSTSKTALSVFL